uniref:Uncharacterized protein n=1 Tax=Timema tahoe TaxID=61484 RepID=A0A7R9FMC2_9NEOP|nr:unnamed protein product [Timema tahoe]
MKQRKSPGIHITVAASKKPEGRKALMYRGRDSMSSASARSSSVGKALTICSIRTCPELVEAGRSNENSSIIFYDASSFVLLIRLHVARGNSTQCYSNGILQYEIQRYVRTEQVPRVIFTWPNDTFYAILRGREFRNQVGVTHALDGWRTLEKPLRRFSKHLHLCGTFSLVPPTLAPPEPLERSREA